MSTALLRCPGHDPSCWEVPRNTHVVLCFVSDFGGLGLVIGECVRTWKPWYCRSVSVLARYLGPVRQVRDSLRGLEIFSSDRDLGQG